MNELQASWASVKEVFVNPLIHPNWVQLQKSSSLLQALFILHVTQNRTFSAMSNY